MDIINDEKICDFRQELSWLKPRASISVAIFYLYEFHVVDGLPVDDRVRDANFSTGNGSAIYIRARR
jgi:hypothetical protein